MNCKQANRIPLTEILEREGYKLLDQHSGGHELRYENPLRAERTASFFVNPTKNVWKDFGGEGGTVVDFACQYKNTGISGALRWLSQFSALPLLEEKRIEPRAAKSPMRPRYEVISTKQINDKGLFYYLHERGISGGLARKYLTQASYRDTGTGKEFYGLALENDQGGYSIRNKYFKTAIAPQSFTTIRGSGARIMGNRRYHIFEGILDFLTVLESTGKDSPQQDTIILNSVNNARAAADYLRDQHQGERLTLHLWFDNEDPGSKGAEAVEKAIGQFKTLGAMLYDARPIYAGYQDPNEKWVAEGKQPFELHYQLMNSIQGYASPEP